MIKNKDKGFSLIELVIVVAIMAVIIAVLTPQFIHYIEKSKQGKDADAAGVIWRAINVAMTDDSIADKPDTFSGDIVLLDNGSMPDFASAIKEYIGDYTLADFKERNIRSNAYKDSSIYVYIDSEAPVVRVTVSSNIVGVDDIMID